MKFCTKCGTQLEEGAKFCPNCGAKIEEQTAAPVASPAEEVPAATADNAAAFTQSAPAQEKTYVQAEPVATASTPNTSSESGPWKAFSIVGFICGIVSLVLVLVPYNFIWIAPFGIVFSCLGKKSIEGKKKASQGFVMSLIAAIINLIWTITFFALIIGAASYYY